MPIQDSFRFVGRLVLAGLLFAGSAGLNLAWADETAKAVDFARDIQPIFADSCFKCHGAKLQKSAFRLDRRADAFKGGESGLAAIIPGKSGESRLLLMVTGAITDAPKMPPQGEPLAAEKIELLKRWIDQGANWPESADAKVSPENHWAYQQPKMPPIPSPTGKEWVRNPIDAFILTRLEKENLKPSSEADRMTLVRRASLDLIGLPPTPQEVDAFVNDKDPFAYEKLVDRLLARPEYGERWAQPWLDLARYADSNGFEKDAAREMWPYRDWVINALNEDEPFDQFTIEQLAGDLLPGATLEQKIASGFNRNSMINEEGGIDQEEYRVKAVIDRAETTSIVWLAMTIGCAQCHDHKYDPISQAEFYKFYAFFNQQRPDLRHVNSYTAVNDGAKVRVPTAEQKRVLDAIGAERGQVEDQLRRRDAKRIELTERLWELSAIGPRNVPTTMTMEEQAEPRETFVHMKGNFRVHGDKVSPGVPAVLPPLPEGAPANRLTLARWLVSQENPLAARVTVNRVWEQYFGHGIVKTTENFGTQGERPVHPELLDWLALTFEWNGWSLKSLHRMIVTSATYRQSSVATPELIERDPDNRLLARGPRFRLPAETIRDQALAASGLLSKKIGGPSVFPFQPDGVWKMPYSAAKWTMSKGEDRFRRGLYTWWQRTAVYPSYVNFDAPSRETSCTRRSRTNTPLQALTALNDPVYFEAAQALARRLVREGDPDPRKRIEAAFRLTLGRPASEAETARLFTFYEQQRTGYAADAEAAKLAATAGSLEAPADITDLADLAAWTMIANVVLNLDETLSKG